MSLTPVHPHVCGEYLIEAASEASTYGSPPRVWGIPVLQTTSLPTIRFTPTCVGNTINMVFSGSTADGSPPRVWGIQTSNALISDVKRFTPTCVGNTRIKMPVAGGITGSPPRVWGIRKISAIAPRAWRFTPTCVGNTAPGYFERFGLAVHPHVCGEYLLPTSIPTKFPVHPHVCGEYVGGNGDV